MPKTDSALSVGATITDGYGSLNTRFEDAHVGGLDLFELTPVDSAMTEGVLTKFRPVSGMESGGPYEFVLSEDYTSYLQLNTARLYGVFMSRI